MFGGGDMNLYGYVSNDPVNLIDPSGLFTPGQCAAAMEMLRLERRYGRTRAARMASNSTGDGTLDPYNEDIGNNPNFKLDDGTEIDIDWFTDLIAHGGGNGLAFYAYTLGKTIWWASNVRKPGHRNPPFTDRGELNAIAHAYMGTDYSDIFTQELLERECGCAY
jgi:hypothetical protein